MSTIVIPGWATNDRIPRVVFALAFGQGEKSPGAAQGYVLFAGSRSYDAATGLVAQGTAHATVTEVLPVYSASDAADKWGHGSDIHREAVAWFDSYPSSPAYGVAPVKGGGATRAVLDMVLGAGTPTESAEMSVYICGTRVPVSVASATPVDDVAADIVAAVNGNADLPMFASYVAGTNTLTFTWKCFGPSGNSGRVRLDDIPAGMTSVPESGNLATGATEPTWTDAYAAAFALDTVFYHVVPATATVAVLNAGTGNLRGRIQDGLAPTVGKLMDVFVAQCAGESAAATFNDGLDLGTTAYNEPGYWFTTYWVPNNEVEPWFAAAHLGGLEAFNEAIDPQYNWIGLEGGPVARLIPPPPLVSSYPTDTELNDAIASGLSPCSYSHRNQTTRLVRSICAKHLIGAANDPTYLENTNVRAVSRVVSYGVRTQLTGEFSGFSVVDDVEGSPPAKLRSDQTSPLLIKRSLLTYMHGYEDQGWVTNVTAHAAVTNVERATTPSGRVLYELPIDVPRWIDAMGGFHREVGR